MGEKIVYTAGRSRLGEVAPMFNVTFEPECRNNWHIHYAKSSSAITSMRIP